MIKKINKMRYDKNYAMFPHQEHGLLIKKMEKNVHFFINKIPMKNNFL